MHIRQSHTATRTNHATRAEGEELVFGLDLASAVGALKELGTEA
jgi:hypothetical protein